MFSSGFVVLVIFSLWRIWRGAFGQPHLTKRNTENDRCTCNQLLSTLILFPLKYIWNTLLLTYDICGCAVCTNINIGSGCLYTCSSHNSIIWIYLNCTGYNMQLIWLYSFIYEKDIMARTIRKIDISGFMTKWKLWLISIFSSPLIWKWAFIITFRPAFVITFVRLQYVTCRPASSPKLLSSETLYIYIYIFPLVFNS